MALKAYGIIYKFKNTQLLVNIYVCFVALHKQANLQLFPLYIDD